MLMMTSTAVHGQAQVLGVSQLGASEQYFLSETGCIISDSVQSFRYLEVVIHLLLLSASPWKGIEEEQHLAQASRHGESVQ